MENLLNNVDERARRERYKKLVLFGKSFCYSALTTLIGSEAGISLGKYVLPDWSLNFWKNLSPITAFVTIPLTFSFLSGVVNASVRLCIYNMENEENGGGAGTRIDLGL